MSIFNAASTRDLAVKTAASLQSHVEECGRNYQASKEALSKLANDLEEKHKENLERFDHFQKQILYIAIVIVAGIAVKGTPLDVIAKIISNL